MASQPIPRARLTIKPVSQPVIERAKITKPDPLDELANNLLTATRTRVPVRNFLPDWLDKTAKKFKKGQSGNPLGAGAPGAKAKKLIANAYKEMANQVEPITGMTYAQLLALSMFYQSINKGNVFASREIREALEGKMSPIDETGSNSVDSSSAKKMLLQRLIKVSETRADGSTVSVSVAEQTQADI